jgi:hypothetical protein
MKIIWQVERQDVEKARSFLDRYRDDPFVQQRIRRNLSAPKSEISREGFWHAMVSCLLTTQQRSGPGSAVARFINTQPFPLSYRRCVSSVDVRAFAHQAIGDFGGLRFANRLSDQIDTNLPLLERAPWKETLDMLDGLRYGQTPRDERKVAEYIDRQFKGFGPKQSRNLLQSLGLTRYEIPIDSRVVKWLNNFGFPVRLSASALADANYYSFVSDGFQQLCIKSSIFPCVLDAAIFTSFDKGGWSETNVIW